MKKHLKHILYLIPLLFTININSQQVETIPLSKLIDLGLSNNPTIKAAQNNLQITQNNHTLEPFLPTLRGTARIENSTTDSKRTFNHNEQEFLGAKSSSSGAGINFTWQLFNGLGMFANYQRTAASLSIAQLQTRKTIEELVVNITTQYYLIVIQEHRVKAAVTSMNLSRERYRIAQEQLNIGTASGIDLQQAQLDFNADSSSYLRQKQQLHNSYISLNRLVNQPLNNSAYINDTIIMGKTLLLNDLEWMTKQNNSELLAASQGILFSKASLNLAQSSRFPVLNFVSAYSYNRSEAPASVVTFNQTKGLSYGFEASMSFFDAFRINKNIKNAKIELENQQLALQTATLKTMAELHALYNDYLVNLSIINFELQSMQVAKSNLDLALERYDLGLISGIEFREFQLSYLTAVDRAMDAMYQSKALEISLLVSSGSMDEMMSRIE